MSRKRLEETRIAITHKFRVGGQKGYLNVGFYEDGKPGEVFLKLDGSRDNGWTQIVGVLLSLCLQYGVPLDVICKKIMHHRFDPSGATENPKIRMASSIPDYIGKWLKLNYGETTAPIQGQETPKQPD